MPGTPFRTLIKKARIRNAWTQSDLGAKVGVTGATISNWEAGKTPIPKEKRAKLTEVLGNVEGNGIDKPGEASVREERPAVGAWLTKTRLASKLSVAELANKSGVSQPSIYGIESGRIANPRSETIRRLEQALGIDLPEEAKRETHEQATIEDVGELVDFDPHDDDDLPSVAGIYVLYDISERPIYVGQASNMKSRIRSHRDKFWFKEPIVETGAYIQVDDGDLRVKVETLLIRFLKSNAVINKQNVDR